MREVAGRFRTFEGSRTFPGLIYDYSGGQPVSVELAMQEMAEILALLSPYSLNLLIGAIDNGKIDGERFGTGKVSDYDYDVMEHIHEFSGCLLGWAGFLERVPSYNFLDTIRSKQEPGENWWFTTSEMENFVCYVKSGHKPASNPYARRFREMVVLELESRQLLLSLPVSRKMEVVHA